MFFEEGMVNQFFYRGPFVGVFLEAAVEEVSYLCANKQITRDFDFILDYFYELFFSSNLEGVFTDNHLIHHDAY
jgi:hypothetical protein